MRCPSCGWTNPPHFTECHKCKTPLPEDDLGAQHPRQSPGRVDHDIFPGVISELIATFADAAASIALAIGIFSAFAASGLPSGSALVTVAAAGLPAILLPVALDSWGGGSIGNRIVGVRVVTRNGVAPGLLRSVFRTSLKYILNFSLPFLLTLVERMLFSPHSLHGLASGTYSVRRKTPPQTIAATIQASRAKARFLWLAKLVGLLGAAAAVGIAATVVLVLTAPPDPKRDALRAAISSADSVTSLAANYWMANGRKYPGSAEDLGLKGPPQGFTAMSFNAANGRIILTPSDPLVSSVRLVFYPELQTKRDTLRIRRWHCGTPDLPRAERPFSCRKDIPGM